MYRQMGRPSAVCKGNFCLILTGLVYWPVMTGTIHLLAAARPNFMKVAPLWHALNASPDFQPLLIHTGQHYDANMSDAIFADLQLGVPDFHLGVGSGTHAEQTGKVMMAYEAIALAHKPDALVVVGDVNSTLAGALVAAKLHIPAIHLEAGLRSGDRRMPEEINRLATDAVCDILWTPSLDADAHLQQEGVPPARITRVGNIMLDSYELVRPALAAASADVPRGPYAIVTLHRPSNVDDDVPLAALVDALIAAQAQLPLIFPVHPRTAKRLAETGGDVKLRAAGVALGGPLPYIRFMALVSQAAAAITDSGGIQEETTYLGIPCLTLRENTERPVTISEGTNRLATTSSLAADLAAALATPKSARSRPEFWDGQTAARCVADLRARLAS
jgi:UDP-N-acetylglucosamine 2-epimerase (non-hydrolysing)